MLYKLLYICCIFLKLKFLKVFEARIIGIKEWWTLRDSKNSEVTIIPKNTPKIGGFNTL